MPTDKASKLLAERLFDIQCEVEAISKSKTNPFLKNKYADINDIIDHLKPLLNKHGVLVIQPLVTLEGRLHLRTLVIGSNETLTYDCILPEQTDPQKLGGLITYFRRYALQSLFLLEAEDDDGNKASHVSHSPAPKEMPRTVKNPDDPPSQAQLKILNELLVSKNQKLSDYGLASPAELTKGVASEIIDQLINAPKRTKIEQEAEELDNIPF